MNTEHRKFSHSKVRSKTCGGQQLSFIIYGSIWGWPISVLVPMLATKLTDTPENTDLSIHTKQADKTFQTNQNRVDEQCLTALDRRVFRPCKTHPYPRLGSLRTEPDYSLPGEDSLDACCFSQHSSSLPYLQELKVYLRALEHPLRPNFIARIPEWRSGFRIWVGALILLGPPKC